MIERFFVDCDDDGHWYLLPENQRAEWNAWRDLDSEDERAWDAPKFASRLSRHVSFLTFTDPKES